MAPASPTQATEASTENPNALYTLLLHPEKVKHGGIAHNGPIRFPVPKTASAKSKTKEGNGKVEMSLDGRFLSPDQPNFLTLEEFKQIQKHPQWAWALDKGVIELVTPIAECRFTGTTADYEEADAYNVIQGTVDIEWLRRCILKDERSEVGAWCQERISEIQGQIDSLQQGNQ
jgi:hypothetical protein